MIQQEDPTTQALSLQMVDALFGVVQDVGANPKAQRKAALKIAEFLLPRGRKKGRVLPDEYGFTVNSKLARHYRDTVRELRSLVRQRNRVIPVIAEKIRKLEARAGAILRRLELPCPTQYGVDQAAKDQERLIELICLREDTALTEEQDAEEAHLRMRLDVFRNGPEETARKRRKELEDVEMRSRKSQLNGSFYAPRLSYISRSDLKLLRWLYPDPELDLSHLKDDDEREQHWCLVYHPFKHELPAADGNFYPKPLQAPAAGETENRLVKGMRGRGVA